MKMINLDTIPQITGQCSCCGGYGTKEEDIDPDYPLDTFYVFKTGWHDSDGVYYSRLCGDYNGNGCIYECTPSEDTKHQMIEEAIAGTVTDPDDCQMMAEDLAVMVTGLDIDEK